VVVGGQELVGLCPKLGAGTLEPREEVIWKCKIWKCTSSMCTLNGVHIEKFEVKDEFTTGVIQV
jgi:hypothetical protein